MRQTDQDKAAGKPPAVDFRTLLDAAPSPYLLLARDFSIVWANQAYLRVTGRSFAELQGRDMFGAFPTGPHDPDGENLRQLRESFDRVLTERVADQLAVIRYAIPADDGAGYEERFWSASHVPILDGEGEVDFILQQTDDVTALHRRQQAAGDGVADSPMSRIAGSIFRRAQSVQEEMRTLDAERRRLLRLFQEAPAFVAFLKGPEHVFELANTAYMQLVGHRDIVGKPLREALPEVAGQEFPALLDRVFRTGEAFIGHGMLARLQRTPDEALEDAYIDFVYQPIIEEHGEVSGIFVLGNDITRQREAQLEVEQYRNHLEERVAERTRELEESEAERRQAEVALRHAQKMEAIGQLTGGVAHDFNNILQVVGGNLQLLRQNLASDRDVRRLDAAVGAVERGAKLAAQLLAFARRQPLAPRVINLRRLIRRLDDLLRRVLGEAVEVATHAEEDLWNIRVDADQVENVLLNLAVNARDAMEGIGRLTIEAKNVVLDAAYAQHHREVEPGAYVMLAVSDTGCGMTSEVLERAFEPFFTTKPEGRGTGLGLSMAYGFVKQSGGHLKIYSEPGHGTTVRIYLPRSDASREEEAVPERAELVGGSETILVVEDDPTVQATVVDMLRELGYRVLEASDGQSALQLARSGARIDLLFTDVVMPGGMPGAELAREVGSCLPGIAVLFTSGYTENAILHGGKLDPDVELLSKPYRQEDLAQKIREVLSNRPAEGPQEDAKAPLRILLVEDDFLIQAATEEILTELGHSVVAVSDGEGALGALDAGQFDVLFCDVDLPDQSGATLAAEATRRIPTLKIVFATGYGDQLTDPASGEPVAAMVLPKPYTTGQIEQVLATLVEKNGAPGPQASAEGLLE